MGSENYQKMAQKMRGRKNLRILFQRKKRKRRPKLKKIANPKKTNSDKTKEAKKAFFPEVEDLEMAEVLGLEKDAIQDFAKVKATYRIAIAQYHPDKVSALGFEIRGSSRKKSQGN